MSSVGGIWIATGGKGGKPPLFLLVLILVIAVLIVVVGVLTA